MDRSFWGPSVHIIFFWWWTGPNTAIWPEVTSIYNTTIFTNNLFNKPSWSRSLSFWWWSSLGAWMRSAHLRTCSRTSLENMAYFYTIYVLSEWLLHKTFQSSLNQRIYGRVYNEHNRIFTKFNFPSWQLSICTFVTWRKTRWKVNHPGKLRFIHVCYELNFHCKIPLQWRLIILAVLTIGAKVHLLTQWYHFCSKVLKVCISGAW